MCDCEWVQTQIRVIYLNDAKASKWRSKLFHYGDVPDLVKAHYDISSLVPRLHGMLLSKSGVERNSSGQPTGGVFVCSTCEQSLKGSGKSPPKFSIVNGFEIGVLPDSLRDITQIEKRLTSLTSLSVPLTVLRGGKHTMLKGHVFVMTIDPGAIVTKLPHLLPSGTHKCLVVIAGRLTPAQKILGMRRYSCRVHTIRHLLEFYISNNKLYKSAGVTIDFEALEILEKNGPYAAVDLTTSNSQENAQVIGDETSSVRNPVHFQDAISEAEETTYHETSSVFVNQSPQSSVETLQSAQNTVLVRNQGSFISDYDNDLLGMAFPDLFPYGRGHPSTERRVKVYLSNAASIIYV